MVLCRTPHTGDCLLLQSGLTDENVRRTVKQFVRAKGDERRGVIVTGQHVGMYTRVTTEAQERVAKFARAVDGISYL